MTLAACQSWELDHLQCQAEGSVKFDKIFKFDRPDRDSIDPKHGSLLEVAVQLPGVCQQDSRSGSPSAIQPSDWNAFEGPGNVEHQGWQAAQIDDDTAAKSDDVLLHCTKASAWHAHSLLLGLGNSSKPILRTVDDAQNSGSTTVLEEPAPAMRPLSPARAFKKEWLTDAPAALLLLLLLLLLQFRCHIR